MVQIKSHFLCQHQREVQTNKTQSCLMEVLIENYYLNSSHLISSKLSSECLVLNRNLAGMIGIIGSQNSLAVLRVFDASESYTVFLPNCPEGGLWRVFLSVSLSSLFLWRIKICQGNRQRASRGPVLFGSQIHYDFCNSLFNLSECFVKVCPGKFYYHSITAWRQK